MDVVFLIIALLAIVGTVIALVGGIVAMGKGTPKANQLSQRLMRMRVFCQGLAIFFLLLAYLTKK